MDGESGIMGSAKTNEYLHRKGIKPHRRGKDQHARYIERRGALFRDVVHRIQGQIKEEGLTGQISFSAIVAEGVFCGNALLSVNGSTPYNGLYGRVPSILPSISRITEPSGGLTSEAGTLRQVYRLREISVQAMVEGSARARLGRAMNTRTTLAAQTLGLKVGE